MKEYYDATYGYDVKVDRTGHFRCGCGKRHVFVPGKTDVIMWRVWDRTTFHGMFAALWTR